MVIDKGCNDMGLISKFKSGDKKAGNDLIKKYDLYLHREANRYGSHRFCHDDLYQVAAVGFVKALWRYSNTHGTTLMTYASWWVRAEIMLYMYNHHSIVSLPKTAAAKRCYYKILGLYETYSRVTPVLSHSDIITRCALDLHVTNKQADYYFTRFTQTPQSLTDINGDDIEVVSDKSTDSEVFINEIVDRVKDVNLAPRERIIFEERVASNDMVCLSTLADSWGCSRERVRQIETSLLKKIRGCV